MRTESGFGRSQCLEHLAKAEYVRIVLITANQAFIELAAFLIDADEMVLRLRIGSGGDRLIRNQMQVVCEIDEYDPRTMRGWWVQVTGQAQMAGRTEDISRYSRTALAAHERLSDFRYVALRNAVFAGGVFAPPVTGLKVSR